jgi:MFS family permease
MSMLARFRALPPIIRRLGWVSFFTDVASEMIYPLLPAFLLSLGVGAEALGLVEGVAESTSAFVKWWTGRLSDRVRRRKPFVVLGYGIATVVRPLLALAATPWHIVVIRTTDRFGKGMRSAPRDAMVADTVPQERRGLAFGYHRMMDNAGAVLGPAVAFTLSRALHWPLRWIFAAAIVPGVVAMATLVFGVKDVENERTAGPKRAGAALDSRVTRYLVVVAVFTLAASADTFLVLRLLELGLSPVWVPVAWLSLNAFKSLTNVPGGHLSDRLGRRRTLTIAWLVYGAAYACFPLTKSVAVTWTLFVLYGAYYGLAEGGEKAIVADLSSPEQRGRAFGALHAITGFAVLPANLLFGILYAQGPAWAFGTSAALAVLAAGLLAAVK